MGLLIQQAHAEYECDRCGWCGTHGMVLINGRPYCKSRCAPLKGPYLTLVHPEDHPIPKKLIDDLRQLIGTLKNRAGIPNRKKKTGR